MSVVDYSSETKKDEMKKNSKLLYITYFYGQQGNCPAEWAADKLHVLAKSNVKTVMLTGLTVPRVRAEGLTHIRVPSLSWRDCKTEIRAFREQHVSVPPYVWSFLPIAFAIGNLVDLVLRILTKGITAGRWGWALSALPIGVWLTLRHRIRGVFATGGPSSAQLVGGVLARLFPVELVCEFQDPLVGATMTRSGVTTAISGKLEGWLAHQSTKLVFVTQAAAEAARVRNPAQSTKIEAVYPGARQFLSREGRGQKLNGVIELLHLGTLYGTRNLNLFFEALDLLKDEGFEPARRVKVTNVGAIYGPFLQQYLMREDFELVDTLPRVAALSRAQKAHCLLLIQHIDVRSRETIPYKTYDYMNIGIPIFGVLNNQELGALIESMNGYTSDATTVVSIRESLRVCLQGIVAGRDTALGTIRIEDQLKHVLPRY